MATKRPYGIALQRCPGHTALLALTEQLGIPFELIDQPSEGTMPVVCVPGGKTWHVERNGGRTLLHVPCAMFAALWEHERRWCRIGYAESAMALVPCNAHRKHELLLQWSHMLRTAFHTCKLPLVHRWFFPDRARTHVAVRVDADWFDVQEWSATQAVLAPLRGNVSWFVTCAGLEGRTDSVSTLIQRGYEVGSHGYYHYTYRDAPNNAHNLRRAHSCLQSLGITTRAFVSPSSKWNPGLQESLEDMQYDYSSEFTFMHDAFPIRPDVGGRLSSLLQVPIHPVSPGNFLRFTQATQVQIVQYYRNVVTHLHGACLPVHLYGHPADLPSLANTGFMESLASLSSVASSTLGAYAQWWKKRLQPYTLSFEHRENQIHFDIDNPGDASMSLAISNDAHEFHLVRETQFSCAQNGGHTENSVCHRIIPAEPPRLLALHRKLNLRSYIGEYLDYEKVTPSAEYQAHNIRTHFIKTTKRLRGL